MKKLLALVCAMAMAACAFAAGPAVTSWDFSGNARAGSAVDGVTATKGGSQLSSAVELKTNKTGSGATMSVLTASKCEWNGKLQFSTGTKELDLFSITVNEPCTAVITVSSSSGSKSAGKVNTLKLDGKVIYDFDSLDAKDPTDKTVKLSKGENKFTGSGVSIHAVTVSK